MGGKMGRADQPSRNSVSAFAVPELPNRYLHPSIHVRRPRMNGALGSAFRLLRAPATL